MTVAIPVWMIWCIGAYVFVSCLATALDENDRTWFGTIKRFLSALAFSPIIRQALHITNFPTAPPVQPEQTAALNSSLQDSH